MKQETSNIHLDGYKKAAVLMPLFCLKDGWQVLYTRRTDTVNHHKGQVSFPGGAIEIQDRSLVDGALRETHEELGIDQRNIRILGQLPQMSTVSGYLITPFVGKINWPIQLKPQQTEVSRVFHIPLNWLSDDLNFERKAVTLMGKRVEGVIFFKPYDGELLWGITASITLQLIELLKNAK